MAHDVFISYSSKDKPIADGVCANLESAGIRCWIAPRDIAPGDDWPTAITRAISQSRIMVLVFSAHSNSSEDVSRELFLAANSKLVIIPFKIENIEPEPGKQYYLARTHWLDAINPPTKEQIRTLIDCVKALLPVREPPAVFEVQSTTPPPIDKRTSGNEPPQPPLPELAPRKKPAWLRYLWIAATLILLGLIGWVIPPFVMHTFPTLRLAPGIETAGTAITSKAISTAPALSQKEITRNGAEMMLVPAGIFIMGSDGIRADEKPQHKVSLNAFYIDKYEVTNALYEVCVQAGGCSLPGDTTSYDNSQFANHPVVAVDWNQARTYCEWRSTRLPSEAEWEYAARGTDGRTYPWGEGFSCEKANYSLCTGGTTPVGSYEVGKSPFGVYDMAGNVSEWVNDWFSETYYQSSPSSNPLGPDTGQYRVQRGGAWANAADGAARSANRGGNDPNHWDALVGFRCALSSP